MSSRLKLFVVLAALVFCVLFSYWNIDKCGFINFDDPSYVSRNYHLFAGFTKANFHWAFTSFYAANWHPLTWLSHLLDYQLYGLRPAGHHLTSLLFHILNTLLLFFALKSMTGTFWRSALVAALFALHPLHVESVAWVSERKDVLCAFFMFIALLCYSNYVHRQRHKGFYVATLLFFMAGLMAKPMIVTLPFVLLLCDVWPFGRFGSGIERNSTLNGRKGFYQIMPLVLEKIPFFFLSLASSVITTLAQRAGEAISPLDNWPILFRLNNVLISYVKYLFQTVWPAHLSYFYPLVQASSPWKLFAAFIILLLITLAAVSRTKKQPFLLVGWLWFLGMLVPVIGIVQVGTQSMADRYTYVPLVGIFIIIAWLLYDFACQSRWLKILAISGSLTALVLLAFQTRTQASYWKNDLTISEHAISVTRGNFLAYSMKGTFLYKSRDYENALSYYSQSLSLYSNQISPRLNIGCVLLSQGKSRESIEHFKKLITADSNNTLAYLNCGKAFASLGDKDSAILCFSRALAIEPHYPPVLFNLGKMYEVLGDCQKSMGYLEQAFQMDPNDAETCVEIGNCCLKSNRMKDAIKWYERAISLSPSCISAHRQFAVALDACGKHDLAQRHVSFADSLEALAAKFARNTGSGNLEPSP
jgi:tetratricopeptide (TPR) repeat protein